MDTDPQQTTSIASVRAEARSESEASTRPVMSSQRAGALDAPRELGGAVGRYLVIERLGRGGMSLVYAAYDPQLDRRVALKVMRPDSGEEPDVAQARLAREAQAMARLSHPNVVQVYDVGLVDDRVYMAMELVEGLTLRDWLHRKRRGWRAIVDVLVRAGRGLAAAHEAGLVHLDVTPRNVLVGADRQVRMVDFGLARAPMGSRPMAPASVEVITARDEAVTNTGMVMGTPGYMAPEQLKGAVPDARTDQFSFCVTAWEALFGQRPYPGRGIDHYVAALERGTIAEPPAARRVPPRLRRLLERGLALAPEQRHSSLTELLDAMQDDPSRRWARRAAAVSLAGGLAVGAWALGRGQVDPCAHVNEELAGIWDDARRVEVRDRLAESPHGRPAGNREILDLLDGYAEAWREESMATCRAARRAQRDSAEHLDLRAYCLRQRLRAFQAVPEVILESPPRAATQWRDAIFGLSSPASCGEVERLDEVVRPPDDEAMRSTVERLGRHIAKAVALFEAGYPEEAVQVARPLVRAAEAAGHAPLEAEVKLVLARALVQLEQGEEAERLAFEALWASDAADLQRLRVNAHVDLVYILGIMHGRTQEAIDLGEWALRIEQARVGDPTLRAQVLANLGNVYAIQGAPQRALECLEEALELRRQNHLPHDLNLGSVLVGLGGAWLGLGEPERALEHFEQGYEVLREHYGPRHPATLVAQENVATALHALERYEDALTMVTASIEGSLLSEREPMTMAHLFTTQGAILLELGRHDEARVALEQATDRLVPDTRPLLLGVLEGNLATLELDQGRPEAAWPHVLRGHELLQSMVGPEHMFVGWLLALRARVENARGEPRAALVHAGQALAILEPLDDPAAVDMRSDAALALAEALRASDPIADDSLIVQWAEGLTPRQWAERAQREADAGGRSSWPMRARAEAWLAAHPAEPEAN